MSNANENMQKKERRLPTTNHQTGIIEKLILFYQGRQDGINKSFTLQRINGKEVFMSSFMSQEVEAFNEARDNLLNRRFITYTDIKSGEKVKEATFVAWIDYLKSRIECLDWWIIPEAKIQEYYSMKSALEAHREALSSIPVDSAELQTFKNHTINEVKRLEREMKRVVIASEAERKENLNTLYKYLEEKEGMVDFMEAHLEPIFDKTISRIGFYYGVAYRYWKELSIDKKPSPREVFPEVFGENGSLIGERYNTYRMNANRMKKEVKAEMEELTSEAIIEELNESI